MTAPLPAEQRLRYWAEHPAGQAEPMRADLISAAGEIERLRQLVHVADDVGNKAAAEIARLRGIVTKFMAVALEVPIADIGDLPVPPNPTLDGIWRSLVDVPVTTGDKNG